MEIPNITLKNGKNVPILGLGTWQLTGKRCINAVKTALDLGYTHIDTAELYGNELDIGEAIKNYDRSKLFITSKIWPYNLNSKRIFRACQDSLRRLKTDYLDLYLLHWPRKDLDFNDAIKGFKEIYESGLIKSFGVSNFTKNHLKDFMNVGNSLPIAINQIEFHPILNQKELVEFCHSNKIEVIAYSPLGRGNLIDNPKILRIAQKYNKSSAQIILNWIISKRLITIPKASYEEHLKENISIFDFQLSKEDSDYLDSLNEHTRFVNPGYAEFDY